jgi:hypothetical protein
LISLNASILCRISGIAPIRRRIRSMLAMAASFVALLVLRESSSAPTG